MRAIRDGASQRPIAAVPVHGPRHRHKAFRWNSICYIRTRADRIAPARGQPAAGLPDLCLNLIQAGGRQQWGRELADQGQPPKEYREALKLQQRLDVERSVAYAKKSLGLGLA